jgi:hypothetical protein
VESGDMIICDGIPKSMLYLVGLVILHQYTRVFLLHCGTTAIFVLFYYRLLYCGKLWGYEQKEGLAIGRKPAIQIQNISGARDDVSDMDIPAGVAEDSHIEWGVHMVSIVPMISFLRYLSTNGPVPTSLPDVLSSFMPRQDSDIAWFPEEINTLLCTGLLTCTDHYTVN